MPLTERITSAEKLRSWQDEIPLHYEYTAGVAGERFLRGLQHGRIIASKCNNCGKMYLPPKMYCTNCYLEIKSYRQVGPAAIVAALAESYVDFQGRRVTRPRVFAFLTFRGVTGGLIHYANGRGVAVGTLVTPKFRAASKRKGTLLDIETFVPK